MEDLQFDGHGARYDIHYLLSDAVEVVSSNELRFRTKQEIVALLEDTGFSVEHLYGDWDKSAMTNDSRNMIFIARKPMQLP